MRLSDIFVMCRKRESLRLAAQALREEHVPFAAAEDYALMDAPEARDLVAVLDVLASPQHDLSLAQALRSPLFAARDDDLIELAEIAAAGGTWWQALIEGESASPALQRARELLSSWRLASQRLPPHDLLDRIVAEGELRERVAATVPHEQRLGALDAIDALLGQALLLDGARYATPYNFVRALRRRAIRVPAPHHLDAVQLLTVHGAKGLEASAVFVMDADPELRNSETATLLVDWPVDSAMPRRCAFVYSESQCPPSVVPVLEAEVAARRREELNGLYVAMSRAKERLVFSSTQPHRAAKLPSWWQRVVAVAAPWDQDLGHVDEQPAAAPPSACLKALPTLKGVVEPVAQRTRAETSADSAATRLGQAVHRVLEWATRSGAQASFDLRQAADAATSTFGASLPVVEALAGTILRNPGCARFFGGDALRWAGNEVSVSDAGEVLRIDRLVAIDEGAGWVWWVLDYKLQRAPQDVPAYREQLLRYQRAVQRAQAGARVRCAFITRDGELVEIEPDAFN
jgi:ATP-dependent helicase/nuclease subunit A